MMDEVGAQRWDSGCWVRICSARAVVPGRPTNCFGQPCHLPSSPGAPQARGWGFAGCPGGLGAPGARAGAGECLQQEAESAGKARLREQERVGVPRHRREAAPCRGQGVGTGAALPCWSLLRCHPQPALGDNAQTCPLFVGRGARRSPWGDVGADGGPWRCGNGWSRFLPVLPVLRLCHVPAEVSGLRQSPRSGDGVGASCVVQPAWGGGSYPHSKRRFFLGLCL